MVAPEINESSQPDIIPAETWVGLGLMTVGGFVGVAAMMLEVSRTMYLNVANVLVLGHEKVVPIDSVGRNLMIGSLAVGLVGAVPFFRGLKRGVELTQNQTEQD